MVLELSQCEFKSRILQQVVFGKQSILVQIVREGMNLVLSNAYLRTDSLFLLALIDARAKPFSDDDMN